MSLDDTISCRTQICTYCAQYLVDSDAIHVQLLVLFKCSRGCMGNFHTVPRTEGMPGRAIHAFRTLSRPLRKVRCPSRSAKLAISYFIQRHEARDSLISSYPKLILKVLGPVHAAPPFPDHEAANAFPFRLNEDCVSRFGQSSGNLPNTIIPLLRLALC